ncbi:MAG: substrate-binding domain-containing protein [Lachnospiraceae bacterium]|nr:substrate-binding domain-containing protein [Robinsoniella sp.]MDY3765240.1 substrate-binding domain-containing protein [Lachnospiraceae bacterium]
MKDNKKARIKILILLAGAGLILLIGTEFTRYRKNMERKNYSVILYQNTENDWRSLLEGIKQAAYDAQVDVNYVTLPQNGTAEDAISLLKREEENGAEGILLAAVDSAALEETVEDMKTRIPIVTVETGIGTEDADITADNYAMGRELGKKIVEDLKNQQKPGEESQEYSVAIICEFMKRSSVVLRYQGLKDYLEAQENIQIMEWSRSAGDYNLTLLIEKMINQKGDGVAVVALDKYATEALIDASVRRGQGTNLKYGFGSTEKIVSGLDKGNLTALMYQNEFNMGYLGLNRLMNKKTREKEYMTETIMYKIVTRDTLYEEENQRLLFPIN